MSDRSTLPPPPPIIRVDQVFKQYRHYTRNLSLRQEAVELAKGFMRAYGKRTPPEPFYALRDVSFSIQRGESVGLIGRNGAGKTTLLRLLSHITRPTSGTVQVNGQFASLIGLGAGFSPDMTGRQNIYLNAAFFGWEPARTREIEADVIAFADIGDFIDAPTKVYSSGMVARLGFSVAIHVLPEIIFLDEVLAVGDAGFAAKCAERLLRLRDEGRTMVMVGHAMSAIESMCTRVLWLHKGQLIMDGPAETVIQAYTHSLTAP